jgi:hypothetical protein
MGDIWCNFGSLGRRHSGNYLISLNIITVCESYMFYGVLQTSWGNYESTPKFAKITYLHLRIVEEGYS